MQRLEACIRDIHIWMVKKWRQTYRKTDIQGWIFVQTSLRPLQIGRITILRAENVKSLGVTMDSRPLTNISMPFAVLLLCTSETFERFVIFWLNRSLKSWHLLDWTIVTASCMAYPRGLFSVYSVFRTPMHAWWHAPIEMIIWHQCLKASICYQCMSESSLRHCCSRTKQSMARAIIFIRVSFKLHSKQKPSLIIKKPFLSVQD